MALRLERRLSARPEAVLSAIRAKAAYWRESQIPSELRSQGAFGVDARIDGSAFELSLQDVGRDPPVSTYILKGTVSADGTGSRLQARVTRSSGANWGLLLFGLGGVWLVTGAATRFDSIAGLVMIFVAVGAHWLDVRREATLTHGTDRGATHLVDKLEDALASVDLPDAT